MSSSSIDRPELLSSKYRLLTLGALPSASNIINYHPSRSPFSHVGGYPTCGAFLEFDATARHVNNELSVQVSNGAT